MFIMINFGYKSRKLFTIDCLAAALFDCIWDACYKQLFDLYAAKDVLFNKQTINHQKKIETEEKKLQTVNAKLKEQQENNPDKKKDDKKAAKKGGKESAPVASSPLEQEKMDLEKSIQFSKNAIVKYGEKLTKIKQLQTKLEEIKRKVKNDEVYVELVDKTGQRKFVKTKLKNQANQFLSDRGIYYLCTVSSQGGDEEEIEPLVHEGFPVRTAQEDATIVGEQVVFTLKKDDKTKKGGKKK